MAIGFYAPSLDVPSITRNLWFRLGLALKLAAILLLVPVIQTQWFVPFVVDAIAHLSIDPWTRFVQNGGDINSFPYGPVMLLVHAPTTWAGWMIDRLTHADYFAGLGFRLSLLISDLGILFVLIAMYEKYWREILLFYWASPLVFYVTYWHGQTDIVPVMFFCGDFLPHPRQPPRRGRMRLGLGHCGQTQHADRRAIYFHLFVVAARFGRAVAIF